MKLQPLNRLNLALEQFRGVYPDASIILLQIFISIALDQGVQSKDVILKTGVPQPTFSRNLAILKAKGPDGKRSGLDLVEVVDDPSDGRRKFLFLTQRGKLVACSLIRVLDPSTDITAANFYVGREAGGAMT